MIQEVEGHNEVSLEPSVLQAKQVQFPQPFLIEEVLQPSDHLSGPPLGAPGLDAVLQMGPHKS